MTATISENIDSQCFFSKKIENMMIIPCESWKAWQSYHDHAMIHAKKHGCHAVIMA